MKTIVDALKALHVRMGGNASDAQTISELVEEVADKTFPAPTDDVMGDSLTYAMSTLWDDNSEPVIGDAVTVETMVTGDGYLQLAEGVTFNAEHVIGKDYLMYSDGLLDNIFEFSLSSDGLEASWGTRNFGLTWNGDGMWLDVYGEESSILGRKITIYEAKTDRKLVADKYPGYDLVLSYNQAQWDHVPSGKQDLTVLNIDYIKGNIEDCYSRAVLGRPIRGLFLLTVGNSTPTRFVFEMTMFDLMTGTIEFIMPYRIADNNLYMFNVELVLNDNDEHYIKTATFTSGKIATT